MEPRLTVRMVLKAYEALLPVATGFVEKSALAFGLGQEEALALTLATEEIFAYLCHISAPGTEVEIRCRSAGYCVDTELIFDAAGFQMRAFNLTAIPSVADEAPVPDTGLLIASRLVDRFNLKHVGKRLVLTLIKDKAYPETCGLDMPAAVPVSHFSIRRPEGEEVKTVYRMITRYCRDTMAPPSADFPGKVADIFLSGEIDAAMALDGAGHMGGVLFWTRNALRVVECFGPYVLHPESDPGMAIALLDRCMEEIARSGAVGLINRYPGTGLPPGYFESLGALTFCTGDGVCLDVEASYRHLGEDKGISVWAHPDLVPFLETQYERFTLAREIRRVTTEGEESAPFSVLSAEVDRFRHWTILRPLDYGEDYERVLEDHVRMLTKEGFRAIFFEMDLRHAWQAHFTPGLLKNGFEPRIVLPYEGKGDLVVFQHRMDRQA